MQRDQMPSTIPPAGSQHSAGGSEPTASRPRCLGMPARTHRRAQGAVARGSRKAGSCASGARHRHPRRHRGSERDAIPPKRKAVGTSPAQATPRSTNSQSTSLHAFAARPQPSQAPRASQPRRTRSRLRSPLWTTSSISAKTAQATRAAQCKQAPAFRRTSRQRPPIAQTLPRQPTPIAAVRREAKYIKESPPCPAAPRSPPPRTTTRTRTCTTIPRARQSTRRGMPSHYS